MLVILAMVSAVLSQQLKQEILTALPVSGVIIISKMFMFLQPILHVGRQEHGQILVARAVTLAQRTAPDIIINGLPPIRVALPVNTEHTPININNNKVNQ